MSRPPFIRPELKGGPDINRIKEAIGVRLRGQLEVSDYPEAMRTASEFAAVDMADEGAFQFFVDLICSINVDALRALRCTLQARVVVHISCSPRIARAIESCHSFAEAEKNGVSQLVVVGSDTTHAFHFDVERNILTVPTSDSYEHLPSKVFAAMAFLSLCGGVEGVLKVDDDHRLKSVTELILGFSRLRSRYPLQIGKLSRINILGLHPRTWHFGKSTNNSLEGRPYTFPGTTRWANGANGYFLNATALRLMLWSYVYFIDYIRAGLYEDLIVSDLLERQGARIIDMQMERTLTATDFY